MTLNYILALIVIECCLSKKQACELFHKTEEEMDAIVNEVYYTDTAISSALKYIFYYERVLPDERWDKRAKMRAILYLTKLQEILKIENKHEKLIKIKELVEKLQGPNILEIKKKDHYSWNWEDRKAILAYQLKYAIPERRMCELLELSRRQYERWKYQLPESDTKERLIELASYNSSMFFANSRKRKQS